MRIDLNCPAEIARAELEEEGVRLILTNLSDRGVDSCEATVRLLDREGKELGRAVHRARALKGRPRSAFSMEVPVQMPEGVDRAEATLDKVWFQDNDVWRRSAGRETEYEPNTLPAGNDLNALRYVAGDGAEGFPSQQAAVWVCVCGRANGNGDVVCARCRRRKETIFQLYNREAVLRQVNQRERQLELQTRSAREETAQMQRQREEAWDARRHRRRAWRRGVALGLGICALGAAIWFAGIPGFRLWQADRALREDRLEEARDTLISLGDFPGAQARLTEAEQRIARQQGEIAAADPAAFDQETMTELARRLREQGDGEADGELADRVTLARARALLDGGEAEKAEALLASLPEGLEGRAELARDCVFARAEAALAGEKYEQARDLYRSLGDYPGAAAQAEEAVYRLGLRQMEQGEYDQAMETFGSIPDVHDSGELILQCWYLKGYTLENQGELEKARLAYLQAGEYEDAAHRAVAIRWRQAEAALAAEDYETALPLYRELDGQEDAREKWLRCATALARAAYKKKDYETAAAYLTDLPEDTRDTRQIRTRALYLGAKAAEKRGELIHAIEMIEKVADYGDAKRTIRSWRLIWARQELEAGHYARAREILEPLDAQYQVTRMREEIDRAEAAAQAAETEAAETAGPGEGTETAPEPAGTGESPSAEPTAAAGVVATETADPEKPEDGGEPD